MKKLLQTRKVKNICLDEGADANNIMDVNDDETSKNYMDHCNNCLRFSAGIRIICTQSVTPLEAQRGQHFLSKAFQSVDSYGFCSNLVPFKSSNSSNSSKFKPVQTINTRIDICDINHFNLV
jgi:hypothetical protein